MATESGKKILNTENRPDFYSFFCPSKTETADDPSLSTTIINYGDKIVKHFGLFV